MTVATMNRNGATHFESLRASRLFPGRINLYVHEVARALNTTEKHVIALTQCGEMGYIDIGKSSNKSMRQFRRIPVCEFDAYILRRSRNGDAR